MRIETGQGYSFGLFLLENLAVIGLSFETQEDMIRELEEQRDKAIAKRDQIKESIRKDGYDPDRPIF